MSATKEHYHNAIESGQREAQIPQHTACKERQILFSTPMVKAILEGRKSQTRRICKHQHWTFSELIDVNKNGIYQKVDRTVSCQYGQPGDLLWARETFARASDSEGKFWYKASVCSSKYDHPKSGWKPSIHMPKEAARIWLEVEEIRVERLQDISEADAIAEGIEKTTFGYKNYDTSYPVAEFMGENAAYRSFRSLFISINKKPKAMREHGETGKIVSYHAIAWGEADFDEHWAKYNGIYRNKPLHVSINPWVWVVKFKILSTTGKPDKN